MGKLAGARVVGNLTLWSTRLQRLIPAIRTALRFLALEVALQLSVTRTLHAGPCVVTVGCTARRFNGSNKGTKPKDLIF